MIRTGIYIAIVIFIGTLLFLYVSAPSSSPSGTAATSTSFLDKISSSSTSTSTIRKIDAAIVLKTSVFLNGLLVGLADWLGGFQNKGALRDLQNAASSTLSNVICTPDSVSFMCDNGDNKTKPAELTVCGCLPKKCTAKQHLKITPSSYDFWSNGTTKGRFECIDN